MGLDDMRRVMERVGQLRRSRQAAAAFGVVAALRPLAGLGDAFVAPAEVERLVTDAMSASTGTLPRVLAEVEALPVMAAGEEPPTRAVFAVDLLACLSYAIKTATEAEPALWSGYCIQRAYDCLWFADERLGRSGLADRLIGALGKWLDGDNGDQLRRESAAIAELPELLHAFS